MTKHENFEGSKRTSVSYCTYDDRGRLSKITSMEDGQTSVLRCVYSGEPNAVVRKSYGTIGSDPEGYAGKHTFNYTSKNRLDRYKVYFEDDELDSDTDFYYYTDGDLSRVIVLDILGTGTTKYTYNNNHDVITEVTVNSKSTDLDYTKTFTYTYDSAGNWLTQTEDDNHQNSIVKRMGIGSFTLLKRTLVYY